MVIIQKSNFFKAENFLHPFEDLTLLTVSVVITVEINRRYYLRGDLRRYLSQEILSRDSDPQAVLKKKSIDI